MGKDLKGKELGKGIRQVRPGKYEARYIDRFGKRVSVYATTKSEIKNKLNQAIQEDLTHSNVQKKLTVKQWYETWLNVYKRPIIRPTSLIYYINMFTKHILPEVGWINMSDVRQIHIQKLINRMDKQGYGWETLNTVRVLLTDLFNIAIENDYANKNPVKGIRIYKARPDERIVLTREQEKDFLICAAGTFYYNLFCVMLNTGLRPGEATALKENDLDFKRHEIIVDADEGTLIYQTYEHEDKKTFHLGPPKTAYSIRAVPMNEFCEQRLLDQIRLKKILNARLPRNDEFSDLIFKSQRNNPICSQVLNDAIKRIVDEINLQRDKVDYFPEFSAHSFRHTFATRCLEAGILPKTLQSYLGHATLQMTMDLYCHVTDEFKQTEFEKLSMIEERPEMRI